VPEERRRNDELILYRLDEIATDITGIVEEQKCLKKKFTELSLTVEHRVTTLETKATVRGAVSGAVAGLLGSIGIALIWLVKQLS
jgi:hypothetical protein